MCKLTKIFSGSSGGDFVQVQVLLSAPMKKRTSFDVLFSLVHTAAYSNRHLRAGYPPRSTRRRDPQMAALLHVLSLFLRFRIGDQDYLLSNLHIRKLTYIAPR